MYISGTIISQFITFRVTWFLKERVRLETKITYRPWLLKICYSRAINVA